LGFDQKHRNHLALIEKINQRDLVAKRIVAAESLEAVFTILRGYRSLATSWYQLAIDLNYSELLDFSENDFTITGPGSEGASKVFH
jgi:hypothetical protein